MRILVIEDNKEVREFLKAALETENFSVDCSAEGDNGFFLARTNEYDLIILDNILPGKDGREICRELRSEGCNVAIIMLSVKSEADFKADILNCGADDYITKPFSFAELLARIKAVLRRPRQMEKEIIKIGNLILDLNNKELKRDGKEIYLTRKEFALFEYFVRNQGKVLSRGEIMEHVWDMNGDPFSNTIEAHILNLRKKINEKGKEDMIKTLPGRGYKMNLKEK